MSDGAPHRPHYEAAWKALQQAHDACFNHPDRSVLGLSCGPFSGVNQALEIINKLEIDNTRLNEILRSTGADNQRFHDKVNELLAEIERMRVVLGDDEREIERIRAVAIDREHDNKRLRDLLRACIKSAEADGDLKESGWWDEQSIIAIENARKELGEQAKG